MTMPSEKDVLIPTGFGLNCEAETAHAFQKVGATVDPVHINDILDGRVALSSYRILCLIGGFSFGDHLGGGRVLAIKLKYRLMDALERFIDTGGLVLGICNGFQVLTKLGLLPRLKGDRSVVVSLGANDRLGYRNDWVTLKCNPASMCVFTKGIDKIELPIRHGEGKIVTMGDDVLAELVDNQLIALQYCDPETGQPTERYPHNPNGSPLGIAGITDPTGRILGLMPHPEGYHSPYNHPNWMHQKTPVLDRCLGLRIFQNAVERAQQRGCLTH